MRRCESPSSDPAAPSRPTMPGSLPWQFSTVFQCSVATSTSTPSRISTARAGRRGRLGRAPSEVLLGLHEKLHPLDAAVAVEGERQVDVHDVARPERELPKRRPKPASLRSPRLGAASGAAPQVRPLSKNTAAPTRNSRNGYQSVKN